jgi:hypothetical protein
MTPMMPRVKAIDDNLGARNIVRSLARQEHDGIGDVFRFADPPPRSTWN